MRFGDNLLTTNPGRADPPPGLTNLTANLITRPISNARTAKVRPNLLCGSRANLGLWKGVEVLTWPCSQSA